MREKACQGQGGVGRGRGGLRERWERGRESGERRGRGWGEAGEV